MPSDELRMGCGTAMNETLVKILQPLLSAIGSEPKRLSIALSLGFTLKAVALFFNKYEPTDPFFATLADMDTIYFVATAFFILFVPLLFKHEEKDLSNLTKDIEQLTELMNNSKLSEMDKRILTRGLVKTYIHRISPERSQQSKPLPKRRSIMEPRDG
jgi:hypothetical protein